ncbi:MAG: HAD family hydrolase [Thermoprotei archaeon]
MITGVGMVAVFLDVGGTLVDFSPPHHLQIKEALLSKGFDVPERKIFRAIAKQYGMSTVPSFKGGLTKIDYRLLLEDVGVPASSDLAGFLSNIDQLGSKYSLYPDVEPFLRKLREEGVRLILVTNATESMDRILENTRLIRQVDGVVSSFRLGVTKPHPRMFEEAKRLAGEPGVHIGDVYEVDYLGAEGAGLRSILLDRQGYYDDVDATRVSNLIQALPLILNSSQHLS